MNYFLLSCVLKPRPVLGFCHRVCVMAKLNICYNYLTIVSHQEFVAFSLDMNNFFWSFRKVIKCTDTIPKSNGSIECCAFSPCGKYFGVCFDKNLLIYVTFDWSLFYVCPGERKASSLQFFPKSKLILIADKSGCVTFYSFKDNTLKKTELSLGHNSLLTSGLITDDEKFIITSDRDVKIRVTNYPNVYNVEQYCLGHNMFVSCIGFLPLDNRILISSSGDGTIRFWDFTQGKQLALYNCNNDKSRSENCNATIIKFVSCKINQMSIVSVLEYKSNEIKLISIKGNLSTSLEINLIKILTLRCIPWDIAFYKETLVCLLPDKHDPVIFWSGDTTEPKENFNNIILYLNDNWDSFVNTSSKVSDQVPILFKREVDNLQEYEKRKKARLLKTGKTS